MRLFILASLCVVFAGSAAAGPYASCVNPRQAYAARALSAHDLWVQKSSDSAAVRVKTSCANLASASGYVLNSRFTCLAPGDKVSTTTSGVPGETCKVTVIDVYAPQEGDSAKF